MLACLVLDAQGSAFNVPLARDLKQLGHLANDTKRPILLVISASDCGYCELLKTEFLRPMIESGEYAKRIIIREWMIDEVGDFRDFQGREVDPQALATRYRAPVTPTLLFLDGAGNELVEPMIGINGLDFYGWYLDQAISAARVRLLGHD